MDSKNYSKCMYFKLVVSSEKRIPLKKCIELLLHEWKAEYKEDAEGGDLESQILCFHGYGGDPKNNKEGLHWLRKAATHHDESALVLSSFYLNGLKGLKKDTDKAYLYAKLAYKRSKKHCHCDPPAHKCGIEAALPKLSQIKETLSSDQQKELDIKFKDFVLNNPNIMIQKQV